MNGLRSLAVFEQNPPVQLFQDAEELPEFFQSNLHHPMRVVKVFQNDPNANIRAFYYQYVKLCFDVETPYYTVYIQKLYEILNSDWFRFVFQEEDDPSFYNHDQFRELLVEFINLMTQGPYSLDAVLSSFPIMDMVFVYFFRAILIIADRATSLTDFINHQDLFQFLTSYFGIEVSYRLNCLQFLETDVFVYEEHPNLIYMAYISSYQEDSPNAARNSEQQYQEVAQEEQPSTTQEQSEKPKQLAQPTQESGQMHGSLKRPINTSFIASQFMDYTAEQAAQSNPTALSALAKSEMVSSKILENAHNQSALSSPLDRIYSQQQAAKKLSGSSEDDQQLKAKRAAEEAQLRAEKQAEAKRLEEQSNRRAEEEKRKYAEMELEKQRKMQAEATRRAEQEANIRAEQEAEAKRKAEQQRLQRQRQEQERLQRKMEEETEDKRQAERAAARAKADEQDRKRQQQFQAQQKQRELEAQQRKQQYQARRRQQQLELKQQQAANAQRRLEREAASAKQQSGLETSAALTVNTSLNANGRGKFEEEKFNYDATRQSEIMKGMKSTENKIGTQKIATITKGQVSVSILERDFTEDRLIEMIKEPHKSKIYEIKKRFVQRSKNLNKSMS